jgi:hypothetical protein
MTPPLHARPSFVALLLAAIAVGVTWPLPSMPGSSLPGNLGDPLLNTWTLGWGSDRLLAGLQGFWDGRAFFPHADTVAFSEHLLGITVFVAPVYWLSQNAVLTYNVAYLASFVHAGLAMWLLVRRLTGRSDVALVAALAFAFPLLRTTGQHTFLHMQVSGWVPLCFWALHRYAGERRLGDALLAAGAFVLAVLTSLYFAFLLIAPVAYAAIVLLLQRRGRTFDLRLAGHALATAALAAAVLAPVLLRYRDVAATHGFARTTAESVRYSADVLSYVSVWHQAEFRPFLRDEQIIVRALFPGVVIAALGLLAAAWRRPGVAPRDLWRWGAPAAGVALVAVSLASGRPSIAGLCGLAVLLGRALWPLPATTAALYGRLAALAFLLSLGPVPVIDGVAIATSGPHAWLLDPIPGASGLRMPARHGVMVSFALAVLAGFGAMRVLAWPVLQPRLGSALAAVAALVVVDGYAGPLPVARLDAHGTAEDRQVHAWIAAQGPGAVMHLPIADSDLRPEVANASVQLTFQYATLLHGQPTVTGGTDFMPVFARWLHGDGSPFRAPADADAGLEMLRRLGVRYVLLHRDEFRTPAEAGSYESDLWRARRHVRASYALDTVLALRLQDPLPRLASPPPPERGPPQRVQCRYLDAGVPAPAAGDASRPSIAATWACPMPDGTIAAARWTFDFNRPETWPTRLRVEAASAAAVPALDPRIPTGLDIELTSRLADAMVTRPASAPQIVATLRAAGASTLLVRTWGARAPRSTPPFWLEVWVDGR